MVKEKLRWCLSCKKLVEVKREYGKPDKSGICLVTVRCAECGMILRCYGQPERELIA